MIRGSGNSTGGGHSTSDLLSQAPTKSPKIAPAQNVTRNQQAIGMDSFPSRSFLKINLFGQIHQRFFDVLQNQVPALPNIGQRSNQGRHFLSD